LERARKSVDRLERIRTGWYSKPTVKFTHGFGVVGNSFGFSLLIYMVLWLCCIVSIITMAWNEKGFGVIMIYYKWL
jgi:uncharacterized membrane protein